jgi:hypothetical protein
MSKLKEKLLEEYPDQIFLLVEGLDKAAVGVTNGTIGEMVVVYDYVKCIATLQEDNDWNELDAIEWMEYNISGAYMGKKNPIFMYNMESNAYE